MRRGSRVCGDVLRGYGAALARPKIDTVDRGALTTWMQPDRLDSLRLGQMPHCICTAKLMVPVYCESVRPMAQTPGVPLGGIMSPLAGTVPL